MEQRLLQQLSSQQELTIIITDSGLGGVGIAAEVYRTFKETRPYRRARLIYFNALFDEQSGYNVLTSLPQKIAVFDTALHGMLRFAPDVILLASNTLSVLYPQTVFAQAAHVPVIGLIDTGINQILQYVQNDQHATVIIFATPVTIADGVFRKRLSQHLVAERIIEHACPGLEHAIGEGDRLTILRLIQEYAEQALQQIPADTSRLYASLNCTHFGYYQPKFEQALRQHGAADVTVINPNSAMARLFAPEDCCQYPHIELSIEFVSKVHFTPAGMASLIPLLQPISAEVAVAFQTYHYQPDLF